MKVNRHGKSSVLTTDDYLKIKKNIKSKKYKLLVDIAWFTGERIGAISKLKITDCYDQDLNPRQFITFEARTRKASPSGKKRTRQLNQHSSLQSAFAAYKPNLSDSDFLFGNRAGNQPITTRWCDRILRNALDKANLSSKGISWHSFRRTFATRLHNNGVAIYTICKILDHSNVKMTQEYVDVSSGQIAGAIEAL